MPPAVCSAECKFVAISPFSQSLIWKRARSASAGRAFPVFRKAHCAFTHIRKPPGTVCRLDALQLQTLSIRTGGRSFSPVSSGASQASYGVAGSGTRLPNGARSLSRRRNANAGSSAQPVRPVRSLQVQPSRTAHDARENLKVLVSILAVSFSVSYHASLISSIIVSLKMMDAVMPIFFEIPAFMPLHSAAFWDSLFSKSHRTSARRIAEITSILHAHRCTRSHALSVLIKLRVHWIYPRKCGIFDTTRSRILFARQHRKALQIQGFSQKNAA